MTSSKAPRPVPPLDGKTASVHARFIPREELASFAAWKPGSISGGPAAATHVQRAAPEEPNRPDPAEALAAQLRAARQSGYQDGYRDGLAALDAFKQSFVAQMTAQIGAVVSSLDQELGAMQQDMARTLAVSATHLARHIVRSELAARPELVAAVAQEAIDTLLLSARHITLRVHPDDHALVALGATEVLAARGARLVNDADVARGGCLVESDIGVIDASIETRWRRAAASLGCDEAWAPAANATDADTPDDATP